MNLIQTNISLIDKNWFQTGGPARFFAAPTTTKEFHHALEYAQAQSLPIFVLGQGANILVSDAGFDGLVIQPHLKTVAHKDLDATTALVTAGAGVTMNDLIEYCLAHNLTGLEEFSGIPGTVGGSLFINLHYFEFLLGQFLVNAQVIEKDSGTIIDVTPDWFNFGYNQSTLHTRNHYLLNATFKLKKVTDLETAYAKGRRIEIIRHRTARYPSVRTCGSFFRNFFPDEVTLERNGKKVIWVAYYLDTVGVKGQLQVGDAIVSHQHANMLVNQGKATSNDLVQLARQMQQLVFDKFGVMPKTECIFVGFKEYPLFQ